MCFSKKSYDVRSVASRFLSDQLPPLQLKLVLSINLFGASIFFKSDAILYCKSELHKVSENLDIWSKKVFRAVGLFIFLRV